MATHVSRKKTRTPARLYIGLRATTTATPVAVTA
jgi:hypothetical protein